MKAFLAAAALLATVTAASAATEAAKSCDAAPAPAYSGIQFFLGIQPSDGPLDVWCRLQQLQGEFKVNVYFPNIKAHRTLMATFDGRPTRSKLEFAEFMQSLLPEDDGPARDEQGMPFRKALENSVQAQAAEASDGQRISLPAGAPSSKAIAIWEPVTIRVAPLRIAGVDFTLEASFRPSVGRFLMALNGQAEDLVLKGFRGAVLRGAGPSGDGCPSTVPDCKGLPEAVELHNGWTLSVVRLHAAGDGMSGAAAALFSNLANDNRNWIESSNWKDFKPTVGGAEIRLRDGVREAKAVATPDPLKATGTKQISIGWRELPKGANTYAASLAKYADDVRQGYALSRSTAPRTQAER